MEVLIKALDQQGKCYKCHCELVHIFLCSVNVHLFYGAADNLTFSCHCNWGLYDREERGCSKPQRECESNLVLPLCHPIKENLIWRKSDTWTELEKETRTRQNRSRRACLSAMNRLCSVFSVLWHRRGGAGEEQNTQASFMGPQWPAQGPFLSTTILTDEVTKNLRPKTSARRGGLQVENGAVWRRPCCRVVVVRA